jgi:hypothetical protein
LSSRGQVGRAAGGLRRRSGESAAGATEHVVGGHAETAVARDHAKGDVVGVGRVNANRSKRDGPSVRVVLGDAELPVGGDHQLAAEDLMIELQRAARVATEVQGGSPSNTHRKSPLRSQAG